jgi:glycosyltransferase involved in cell wall biosynthesis
MSQSVPLVSVMMPCRNAARYLEATVISIQNQTCPNWELVFVDDGSTDETLPVIKALAEKDARIRVFTMSHGGRGRARNLCIENVLGEFVAICDSDDISFPERFAKQLDFLNAHPEIGVVGSWWIPFATEIPDQAGPIRTCPTDPMQFKAAFSRGKMRFHNATAMIRTDLFKRFGKYNVGLRRAQDYEFFSRLCRGGVLFAALPEPLLYYRQESDIPSLQYFRENGMYMAYADRILDGAIESFDDFASSVIGRVWHIYYTLKFGYFYTKIFSLRLVGH